MLVSSVDTGFRLATFTVAWAARWRTVVTSYSPSARSIVSCSRRSPRTTLILSSNPDSTSSERGTQSRTSATTSAWAARRYRTTHEPTSPVAPVTKTGLFRQKDVDAAEPLFPGVNVNGLRTNLTGAQVLPDAAQHRRRPGNVVLRLERLAQARPDCSDGDHAGHDRRRIGIALLDEI